MHVIDRVVRPKLQLSPYQSLDAAGDSRAECDQFSTKQIRPRLQDIVWGTLNRFRRANVATRKSEIDTFQIVRCYLQDGCIRFEIIERPGTSFDIRTTLNPPAQQQQLASVRICLPMIEQRAGE